MNFYLGAHHGDWLADERFADIPLFVSHRTLARYRKLPRAIGRWALDSGGFTELSLHGRWITTAAEYARAVRRYASEVGGLVWASPQDWMCEPQMLAKTGLTVEEHQRRTVENFLELRGLGVDVVPVLQGWSMGEYFDCADMYARAGVDLLSEPTVGVGTICRRQKDISVALILSTLVSDGLRVHPYGCKKTGLTAALRMGLGTPGKAGGCVVSSDSTAWSVNASYEPPLPECAGKHKSCSNCPIWAINWRSEMVESLGSEGR